MNIKDNTKHIPKIIARKQGAMTQLRLNTITLPSLQKEIVRRREAWGFKDVESMLLNKLLQEEVQELDEAIVNKYISGIEISEDDKSSLKHEIADVAIFLIAIASQEGIDIQEAIQSKMKINDKRFGTNHNITEDITSLSRTKQKSDIISTLLAKIHNAKQKNT